MLNDTAVSENAYVQRLQWDNAGIRGSVFFTEPLNERHGGLSPADKDAELQSPLFAPIQLKLISRAQEAPSGLT